MIDSGPEETITYGNAGSKILAILVLGIGSFVSGIVPLYCSRQQMSRPTLITVLLCFGAGVLLATALVHMLPEVRLLMPRYAEIVFCVGYFLIYAVEELVHLCAVGIRQVGDDSSRLSCCSGDSISLVTRSDPKIGSPSNLNGTGLQEPSTSSVKSGAAGGTFSLLLALCVHSVLEGLAIGVQNSAPKVVLLLGAVSAHKFVVAFCLGVEISSHGTTRRSASLVQIVIFSLGSVGGIAIGMALDGLDDTFNQLVIPVLQGVAGGTLLYVTVSEVLPRERGKRKGERMDGLWQLLAVIAGFSLMSVLSVVIIEG